MVRNFIQNRVGLDICRLQFLMKKTVGCCCCCCRKSCRAGLTGFNEKGMQFFSRTGRPRFRMPLREARPFAAPHWRRSGKPASKRTKMSQKRWIAASNLEDARGSSWICRLLLQLTVLQGTGRRPFRYKNVTGNCSNCHYGKRLTPEDLLQFLCCAQSETPFCTRSRTVFVNVIVMVTVSRKISLASSSPTGWSERTRPQRLLHVYSYRIISCEDGGLLGLVIGETWRPLSNHESKE